MKRSEAFPSKYLKAEDFVSGPATVKMGSVVHEVIGGDDETEGKLKSVLVLTGGSRRLPSNKLVLNQTRWDVIEALYGVESDDWEGQKIELYYGKTPFKGKVVPTVAVRAAHGSAVSTAIPAPKVKTFADAAVENPVNALDDDIPF